MIIFFNKNTGNILGTIDGRIHSKDHLNVWIGDKENTHRLVINWKISKVYKDEYGNISSYDYEPDCKQKDIFIDIDKGKKKIYDFKVNIENNELILL